MLPFCTLELKVLRKDYSPPWVRRFPISKVPQTIGEHLRKRRFLLGILQSEAAKQLGISDRTLSLWESDKTYPTWPHQPGLVAYLGYDPFTDPALGMPMGNETKRVAFLSPGACKTLGEKIRAYRIRGRKTARQFAKELSVSLKTLHAWETNRRSPTKLLRLRIVHVLGFDPEQDHHTN